MSAEELVDVSYQLTVNSYQLSDNRQQKHRAKNQEPRLCSANFRFSASFRPPTSDNRQQITDNRPTALSSISPPVYSSLPCI